jgi:diguanylate cyclase (GGDEF)-like protein
MPEPGSRQAPDYQERYGVLLDIGRTLTGTLEPAELYRVIYEQASRVLETTGFYISLYDPEEDEATVVFLADRGKLERPGITYRGSESRAIRDGCPYLEYVTQPRQVVMVLGGATDEEVTRSVLAAPMVHDGRVLGVMSAQSYRTAAYTESDLELLVAIADLAAVALLNARSMAELERQRRESEQLEVIGRALSSSLELGHVLQRIVTATRELVQGDGAAVWLIRPDGRAEIAIADGATALPVGTTIDVPDALYDRFRNERRPLVLDRRRGHGLVPSELLALLQAESGIAVPLVADEELVGALSVSHHQARRYTPHDIRLLDRFAFQAAIAVANARLHEQVRLLSLTDPLTELPNRRHMDIVLEKEFAAAERGRNLFVVLLDLDDFKVFNDTAGHQAGDAVLRRFARILGGQTRAMNLAARYGGDEFIVILSDTDEVGAQALVTRVEEAVQRDPTMRQVGFCAGVAGYSVEMGTPEDLIRKADALLYEAKSRRDRRLAHS